MDREDTEKRVISALADILVAGRLDDVEGDGRETSCYCSDSNGVVKIQDIFRAFEAHYDLIPKSEMSDMDRLTQLIHKAASVEGITREERSEWHRILIGKPLPGTTNHARYLDTQAADRFHGATSGSNSAQRRP